MRYRIVLKGWVWDKKMGNVAARFWWVLKSAGNGARLATSEVYTTRAKAFKTADALAKELDIEVEDHSV